VKFDLYTADSASVDDRSKTYALGLGWTHIGSPTPPMALLAFIDLQPDEVPAKIQIHIELLDSEGRAVHFRQPGTGQEGPPVMVDGTVDASAVDETAYRGEPIRVPFVVQLGPGLVMDPGLYRFRGVLTREGNEESVETSQYFRVREPRTPATLA
jgi:hypothetical protein